MSDMTMQTLFTHVLEQVVGPEGQEVEYKLAQGGLPGNLWSTVSAFANTYGGWIVLGVRETGDRVEMVGVDDSDALIQNFHNLVRNPQKISYAVCGADDVFVRPVQGRDVVFLRIPVAPRSERPVYINGNPYGGTYLRRHTGDYHCSKQDVDRFMRDAADLSQDTVVLRHFGLDDLDRESLARYRRRYQTEHPESPWNGHDDRRFLEAIGGYRRDRERNEEGLTVAGLLTFGTAQAILEWRKRHLIDYRQVPSAPDSDTRWLDRAPWESNLFGAFETIYPRLIADLPTPFRLKGGVRVDQGPVHTAVREALVNLLVHTGYSETQASLIKRSPEGFLFRNPGNSRVSQLDLLTGDCSDPRNPILVRMFRLCGLADEAGTGFPKIIQAWRELGFQFPLIDVGTERYQFTLDLRYVHLISEEDRGWLRALGDSWTEAEQLALIHARHEGEVDNLRLRTLAGLHPADATKVLGSLRDRGVLQMIGGKRGARYQLGPAAADTTGGMVAGPPGQEQLALPLSSGQVDSLGGRATLPIALESKEQNLDDLEESLDSSALSPDSSARSPDNLPTSSDNLWPELLKVSERARQQRYLDAATRDALIVELCRRTPLSVRQLGTLLGRSEPLIRTSLRSLVAAGRVTYQYPEQLSHPRQKYTGIP